MRSGIALKFQQRAIGIVPFGGDRTHRRAQIPVIPIQLLERAADFDRPPHRWSRAETVRDRSVLGSRYIEFRIEHQTLRIDLVGYLESSTKLLSYVDRGKKLIDAINDR